MHGFASDFVSVFVLDFVPAEVVLDAATASGVQIVETACTAETALIVADVRVAANLI